MSLLRKQLFVVTLVTLLAFEKSHVLAKSGPLRFQPNDQFQDFMNTKNDENNHAKHWAVIVAGSNGWYNYRHQADACHAYQVLLKHGVQPENIITMMYGDIANNSENPHPGVIINHPDGPNVYEGVQIDYSGQDVTPDMFLAVLSGDSETVQAKTGNAGKVVKSGPKDHIFVNFVDHGAPGILAFPTDELKASDLMNTITNMYKEHKYSQMVLYVEACESGSMFDNLLPSDINVYATTAANSVESSYACYYDEELNTYLGDVYSVKWMEDSDKENLNVETLHTQFKIVKDETNTSHVQEFGDVSIADDTVAEFQGKQEANPVFLLPVPLDEVASEDVRPTILRRKLKKALASGSSDETVQAILTELESVIQEKAEIEMTMKHIAHLTCNKANFPVERILNARHSLADFQCYEPTAEAFDKMCYDLSQHEYALRSLYVLVNLCQEGFSAADIISAITQICG